MVPVCAKIMAKQHILLRMFVRKKMVAMVKELNKNPILDQTERYRSAGLTLEFIMKMENVVAAIQSVGYVPYDQLYGYVMSENDQYITRHGGAREIVTNMDVNDIKAFLKQYKNQI